MNENLLQKNNVKKFINCLKYKNENLRLIQLDETARTALDASKSLKVYVGSIVKSIIFKSYNNNYYLFLVSGDKYVSTKIIKKITNTDMIKANADEVKIQTGYSIGGVPPICHNNDPKRIFIDINLGRFNKIYAAAGHSHVVFEITYDKLCIISKGEITNFVE